MLLLQLLQKRKNIYLYVCYRYLYYHTTLLLNTLLQILSYPGVVELTTQLLILKNILWLPLCRINKFGLNTLPSKAVAIPYTCGLSDAPTKVRHDCWGGRMRAVHHPRRMKAAARLGHGAAAAERKKWSEGDMNDGGGDVMRRRGGE